MLEGNVTIDTFVKNMRLPVLLQEDTRNKTHQAFVHQTNYSRCEHSLLSWEEKTNPRRKDCRAKWEETCGKREKCPDVCTPVLTDIYQKIIPRNCNTWFNVLLEVKDNAQCESGTQFGGHKAVCTGPFETEAHHTSAFHLLDTIANWKYAEPKWLASSTETIIR